MCFTSFMSDPLVPLLLHMQQTFHTPSLGDEVFEIPPISLDPDPALGISEFELTDGSDGAGGPSGSRSLVSNLVVEANDPSFASTFVNSGSQGLEQLNLGGMGQVGVGGLLSSSALVSVPPVDPHTKYCWMCLSIPVQTWCKRPSWVIRSLVVSAKFRSERTQCVLRSDRSKWSILLFLHSCTHSFIQSFVTLLVSFLFLHLSLSHSHRYTVTMDTLYLPIII